MRGFLIQGPSLAYQGTLWWGHTFPPQPTHTLAFPPAPLLAMPPVSPPIPTPPECPALQRLSPNPNWMGTSSSSQQAKPGVSPGPGGGW